MTQKERLEVIRKANQVDLAKRGKVETFYHLLPVDQVEEEDMPTSEKLKSILKCTNGNSQGDFFENVDGGKDDE
jgi:hypothetical protein|tara:strand:- start:1203 stop:1424 length:222 start_codon:yes stop_codon:yes gene_type:complete